VLANLETVKDAEQRQEWQRILKRLDTLLAPAKPPSPTQPPLPPQPPSPAPASSSGTVK
jgi:hypothetical protein